MGLGRFLVPGPNSGARTQIHASAYPDRTVLLMYGAQFLMYGAQFSAAIDFPTGRISTTLRDQYLPSRFQ